MAAGRERQTRRRRPVEEWGSYLFEINHIRPHYSFGNGSRFDRTAFSEHLHPEWEATCQAPDKFKGRMTKFTLIGDRSDERDQWEQKPADEHHSGVGTLTFRGQRSEYLGSLPFDPLWNIVLASISGGFKFIYLHGSAIKHGTARIASIGFYQEFDLEDV